MYFHQFSSLPSLSMLAFFGKWRPLHHDEELRQYFDVLIPISHEEMDIQTAIDCTYDNLVRTGKLLSDLLSR